MSLRSAIILIILSCEIKLSLNFNPDDDYYAPPHYNDVILQPAEIFLGEDDRGCICRENYKLQTVCFGRNRCDKLPIKINITTSQLMIMSTEISGINRNDLNQLSFLEVLKVDSNYNLMYISSRVFENFTKLRNLSIINNYKLKSLNKGTFIGLKNLKHLYLINNGFTNVYDIAQTLLPSIVPNLLKLSLNGNTFKSISQRDFIKMENSSLEELDLIFCKIDYIHPKAFIWLENLKALRLGRNGLNETTIGNVVKQIIKHDIHLRLLNLYSIGFGSQWPKDLLKVIASSNITHLNLAKNNFQSVPSGIFPPMPNLLALNLNKDAIFDIADDAFKNLPNLQSLVLSNNIFLILPKGALPASLKKLDINQKSGDTNKPTDLKIPNGIFSEMENLEYLNMDSNNIPHLYSYTFQGLTNLNYLTLNMCSIFHIQNGTFSNLTKLTILNLENNFFVTVNSPVLSEELFEGLDNLEVLLLGGNGIKFLSKYGNPFSRLKSLKTLSLKRNLLLNIPPLLFSFLPNLHLIDLSLNSLETWKARIFTLNTNLKILILNDNKLTYLSSAMLEDFSNLTKLSLSHNPLNCDCKYYKNINYYDDDVIRILDTANATCLTSFLYSNHVISNIVDLFKSVGDGYFICDIDKRLVILLPLVLCIITFVLLAASSYYYRWHIKYWMFLARLHLSRRGKISPKQSQDKPKFVYEYDAFISYSCEDRNFVIRLVAMLENHEPFLKLCVYERDFRVGKFISDCVLKCIAKSRKTVLVVSDNYAQSQWCRWESSIAEHHRLFFKNEDDEYVNDSLVIIKLGPVSKQHMTPMLRYLLKTRIYLEWNADEKKQKVFWAKLRKTLGPHKTEKIAEITHI